MALNFAPTNGQISIGKGRANTLTLERDINARINDDLKKYNDDFLSKIMETGGGMYDDEELNKIITRLRMANKFGFELTPTQNYFMINAWA